MNYYLALDIGGTNIKSGVINSNGNILSEKICEFDSFSSMTQNVIIDNFISIIEKMMVSIDDKDKKIIGLGLAFPGPFDYENGISYIRGIGKYDNLYNIKIKEKLIKGINDRENLKRYMISGLNIIFINDVTAFAIGEDYYGNGIGYNKVMHLCIGTGAGSSFTINKKPINTMTYGVPNNGWIYNIKFKESIIDDYISARGLMNITRKYYEYDINGKQLNIMAQKNELKVLNVFDEFGSNLYEAIVPFLIDFDPQCLILGGQICKSYKYFSKYVDKYCYENNINICVNTNTSKSTLMGIYYTLIF